jgi:hypothetical protein
MTDEPRIRTSASAVRGRNVDLGPAMALVTTPCPRCGEPCILATDEAQRTVVFVDPAIVRRGGGIMLAGRYARWAIPMAVNITEEEKRRRRRNRLPAEYRNVHQCQEAP